MGRPKISPKTVRKTAVEISRKKDVFWIPWASSRRPAPRAIEKRGAPPLPYILVKAVIRMTRGKQRPTAPRAAVPIPGMRAI